MKKPRKSEAEKDFGLAMQRARPSGLPISRLMTSMAIVMAQRRRTSQQNQTS
ncbi:hypothetical protein [Mesorhizobium sp. M0715]|uniref:hypothetical protein n=1 Tax=Mesorhizobium sp. M0715 TaxID=2956990 RepID=UPI00333BE4AB